MHQLAYGLVLFALCALMTSFVWAYIDHRGIVKDPDELVDLEDYVRKRGFKQRCSSGKH